MRVLGFSIVAVVITALLFMTGLFSSSPVPLLAGFCGWTPAVFFLGWSIRTLLIGKRLVLLREEENETVSSNHQKRVKSIVNARNM